MLTSRGWNFLIAVLALFAFGLGFEITSVSVIALTLLAWLLANWLVFAVRVRWGACRLYGERRLRDRHGPVRSLWARSPVTVHVRLESDTWLPLGYVRVTERLPVLLERRGGRNWVDGTVARDAPLEFAYEAEAPAAGGVRFE